MKYMLMMFGSQAAMMETATPEWVTEMITFMHTLNSDLESSGELVEARGLVDGSEAKLVSLENGLPVTTDGPYAESKESLIGFWVVDVDGEARAVEIAARIAKYSRVVEVRHVADGPPDELTAL